jgi:hypothetical protein
LNVPIPFTFIWLIQSSILLSTPALAFPSSLSLCFRLPLIHRANYCNLSSSLSAILKGQKQEMILDHSNRFKIKYENVWKENKCLRKMCRLKLIALGEMPQLNKLSILGEFGEFTPH